MRSETSTLEVLVFIKLMARLFASAEGAVAVTTAIVLPILLGFSALGVEVGHWYLVQRQMQGAADAAAISAAAEFIAQYNPPISNINSTTYQTVGQSYALLNLPTGFTVPKTNICLYGVNCGGLEYPFAVNCPSGFLCIVAEITQNAAQWLTTKASMEPDGKGGVNPIPAPV